MPKYLFFITALWFLLNMPAQAQEKASRWSIGITAGPTFPVGEFAGYHSSYASPGGVNTGESAELSGQYRICRSFGVAMSVSGQLNHGTGIPYTLRTPEQTEPYRTNTGINNDWQVTRLLTGGVYTLPLSNRRGPALLVRLLGGIQKVRTPDYSYIDPAVEYLPGYSNQITQPGAALHWVFSYAADAGLEWKLSPKLAFLGYGGYAGGERSKETSTVIYNCPNGGCGLLPPSTGSFGTGTIFLRAGVAFWL